MDLNKKIEILQQENERLQNEIDVLKENNKLLSSDNQQSIVDLLNQYKESYFEAIDRVKNYDKDYLDILKELNEIKEEYKSHLDNFLKD